MKESCESVMSKNVSTCSETDTVAQAAQIMRERNIGLIPVIDAMHHLKGVVTDRDLALRVLADNKSGSTELKSVMTQGNLVTVSPSDPLKSAEEKMMKARTGRALVTDQQGKIVGVISRSEIAHTESRERAGEVLGSLTRGRRKTGAAR